MWIQKTTPWIHYSHKFQLRGMLKCQEMHLIHHLPMNEWLLPLPIQISEECLYGTDAFDAYQLPLPDPKRWEFCVQNTKYFFYIFDNIIWFSKSSLMSHETTSTTTNPTLSPWHCHTAGAKTKIYKHQKIINTIATFTLLPRGPLSLPHSHSAINIIVAIISTSITNQHCFNITRKRPVLWTFNHGYRKLLLTPAKDNK